MNPSSVKHAILGTVLASALVVLPEKPAAAYLQFCNTTGSVIETSIGFYSGGQWWAQGWWQIQPGDCKTVLGEPLTQRYYYYHGHTLSGNRVWRGNHEFCVSSNAFMVADSNYCGEKIERFKELDVGGYTNFILNFQ